MDTFFPPFILSFLEGYRQLFSSPNYRYFQAFLWGFLLLGSRKCITKIADCCFFCSKHISSFERFLAENPWSIVEVSRELVKSIIEAYKEKFLIYGAFLVGLDSTFCEKASKKMIGIQKWHDHSSNPGRGGHIEGHNLGIAGMIGRFGSRFLCWPVLTRLISGKKNPSCYVCASDGEVRPMDFIESLLSMVFEIKEFLKDVPLRVVADAYFAKANFIEPLIQKGVNVITRWRKDGVGWEDPPSCKKKGRPCKKGKKWKLAELIKRFDVQEIKVHLYGRDYYVKAISVDLWIRGISKKVRVVVVEGKKEPIIFVSTDLSLTAKEIIEIYGSRFQIEITIRELKQYFGFGDYQATTTQSIVRFTLLSCVAHCLGRLLMLSEKDGEWLDEGKPKTIKESQFSFARVRRGLKRFVIKQILFSNSAVSAEVEKIHKEYDQISKIAA